MVVKHHWNYQLLLQNKETMKDLFQVIICDPPFSFGDKLQMSKVKRGAAANYSTMSIEEITALPIKDIADPNGCLLALWVPSALLQDGLAIMSSWNFTFKQTYIWTKQKKEPFKDLLNNIHKSLIDEDELSKRTIKNILSHVGDTCKDQMNDMLQFGMGHLFRQAHEIALIGINNNAIYSKLMNRSQRSVSFAPNLKHSMKPSNLHQSLELMFPTANKAEIFARHTRNGWTCIGNQCQTTMGQDIKDSLTDLIYQ